MQEELHPLVLALREAVCLGVECGRHVLLDSQFSCQRLGEVRHESGVSIGYDFIRQAKPSIDVFKVQAGHAFSSYGCRARKEQCRTGTPMVDNSEDGIMTFAFGECRNQIHRYYLEGERFRGNWNFIERNACQVRQHFILLAHCTSFNVIRDPLIHSRPPVGLRHFADGPVSAWVSHLRGVMGCLQ